jgi:hypothetical protein
VSLRYALILGALAVALAVAVPLVGVAAVETVRQLEALYIDGSGDSALDDMAAVMRAQALASLLPGLAGWLALAAAIPGIGSLVLLSLRVRETGTIRA